MTNIAIERNKMKAKWANLIFALIIVSTLLISLVIIWLNR